MVKENGEFPYFVKLIRSKQNRLYHYTKKRPLANTRGQMVYLLKDILRSYASCYGKQNRLLLITKSI